ncbi:hypothetical protein AAEO56_02805 [Flavobacterium sp. DGU11]|uniref:Oxygen tolerance n=1 Tax=Flavobacterium arundinis TaxID=3139143 RepID=A0ABU9HSN5_9FLAO
MKIKLSFVMLLMYVVGISQISVNVNHPVTRNFSYVETNGLVKFKTIFNVSDGSNGSIDVNSVRYKGVVKWLNRADDELISGRLEQQSNLSDFIITLKDRNNIEFENKSKETNLWDNITVTVSYELNGLIHTLPSYIIYSNDAQQVRNSKITIEPRGVVLPSNKGIVLAEVTGVASVELTAIDITYSGGTIHHNLQKTDITGSSLKYEISIPLPNSASQSYDLKLYGKIMGNTIESPIKTVSFQKQVSITGINGNFDVANGFIFNLEDKDSKSYTITTSGDAGKLEVEELGRSVYQAKIDEKSPGVYVLLITSNKTIFDDDQSIYFKVNGKRLEGDFKIIRPYPSIAISAEQTSENSLKLSLTLSSWISQDIKLEIPNTTRNFILKNSGSKVDGDSKIFTEEIGSKDFKFDDIKDSLMISTVKVIVDNKTLLTTQYKFVNLSYYKKKIEKIQSTGKNKSEKKEEIEQVVKSLFKTTGNEDKPLITSISKKLSSKEDSDKKEGWQNLVSYAIKFAPALIALL